MNYISMFSGIEAATAAWRSLGWNALAYAEVDAFPSAVLAHHYPDVPNVGDMTRHDWSQYRGQCDLVVGGPPCQAFSVAGLRQSLSDDRGNLSLAYVRAIRTIDPLWSLTENVPGWLSTADNAFGCVLAGLVGTDAPLVSPLERGRWPDAGVATGPERTAAWRIIDAQFLGLAQRRRRVFVLSVRGAGNWACASALLPVGEGLFWHPAPRRETGQDVANTVEAGAGRRRHDESGNYRVAPILSSRCTGGGGLGSDFDRDGGLIASTGDISHCLNAGGMGRIDYESETLLAHAFDARQSDVIQYGDKTGPLDTDGHTTAVAFQTRGSNLDVGDVSGTFGTNADRASGSAPMVAFSVKDYGGDAGDIAPTLRAGTHDKSHANGGVMPAIAQHMAVRRLTPKECARLQGFPDTYLDITYRGKPAADGPKYKALGNSFAVPVIRWIGERIQAVEDLALEDEREIA